MPTPNALLNVGRLNNFRLNALDPVLVTIRRTQGRILLNGVDVRGRVRVKSVAIRDSINDSPDSASFTIEGPAQSPYTGAVLADAPIAYWRLGDVGMTAFDQTGHGHTGTVIGAVTLNQPGAVSDGDRAMHFPGVVGARVEVAAAAELALTAAVTVEAWVKTDLASQQGGILEKTIGGAGSTSYLLYQSYASWVFALVIGPTFVQVTVPVESADVGHWVHLVGGWYNGAGQLWLYKNGVVAGTAPVAAGPLQAGAGVLELGHLGSNTFPFTGTIDEVAVYPYLSADRIAAHYADGLAVAAPTVAQEVRISIGVEDPVLLFNGAVTQVDLSYEGRAYTPIFHCTATDDTARANRRRPFGQWMNVSATVVAQALIAQFVPGFGSAFVQPGLPPVTVLFDGSEGMNRCLTQVTNLIGGYWYFSDGELHLFQTEHTDPPDPIDATHRFLADPRVTDSVEMSQVRTRVYGRGHGEALLSAVLPGESLIPIADATMFNPAGGHATALTQILTYTGCVLGGDGTFVGPSVTPAHAPAPTAAAGAGALTAGVYGYSYTFITANGETVSGPRADCPLATMGAPTDAPTFGPDFFQLVGLAVGVYGYCVTFLTVAGESTPGPSLVGTATPAPDLPGPIPGVPYYSNGAGLEAGTYEYVLTYRTGPNLAGMTTLAGPSITIDAGPRVVPLTVPTSPAGWPFDGVIRDIFRRKNGTGSYLMVTSISSPTQTYHYDALPTGALSTLTPPPLPTYVRCFTLVTIPLGPPGVTGRKLYRTGANGSAFLLLATIADNSTTGITDAAPDSSLGAPPPSTNTTRPSQIVVSQIAIGPAGVTARKVYRTAVDGAQLRLLATLANNSSTSYVDTLSDATLGANVPTGDTSGLTQPNGQVNAGAVSMPVASAAPFVPTGGWATVGVQVIRYTGIAGNSLTGIPASGIGALVASVRFGEHLWAAPMLTGVTVPGGALLAPVDTVIYIWIQRDDAAAQAAMARLDGGDGIYEYLVQDERRGEPSLTAICDAHLTMYKAPIQTVTYATRDLKTKSGKPVTIDLASPPILGSFVIQDVAIDQFDIAPGLAPRFVVTASTVRFSFEDLLRQLAGTLESA
jgi:hypothetical protein